MDSVNVVAGAAVEGDSGGVEKKVEAVVAAAAVGGAVAAPDPDQVVARFSVNVVGAGGRLEPDDLADFVAELLSGDSPSNVLAFPADRTR